LALCTGSDSTADCITTEDGRGKADGIHREDFNFGSSTVTSAAAEVLGRKLIRCVLHDVELREHDCCRSSLRGAGR
jgi:hypothetical protein